MCGNEQGGSQVPLVHREMLALQAQCPSVRTQAESRGAADTIFKEAFGLLGALVDDVGREQGLRD